MNSTVGSTTQFRINELISASAGMRQAAPSRKAPSQGRIKIMVVDDHPVVLKGIVSCFNRVPHIEVVGEASNPVQALRMAVEKMPDIVLLDLELPQMNGLALADQFRMHAPQIKVIMLTMHHRSEYIMRAIQCGACGYLLKDGPSGDLVQAVETVHAGQTYFRGEVAMVAVNQMIRSRSVEEEAPLTPREKEVLVQIAEGLSNKEIASLLDLGVRTVETHRERIMRKLKIHSIAGLTRYAISEGYVPLKAPATALSPA